MQTAASYNAYPPQMAQSGQKKSNGMVKASFIIGICLVVFEVLRTLILTPFLQGLLHKGEMNGGTFGIITFVITFILFAIPGLLGLILGIVGFRRMVKDPPPYDYFTAIAGIALCFLGAFSIISMILNVLAGFFYSLFR